MDYVRGKAKVVAVSDAYKLAPWADILVSFDSKWWANNKAAVEFAGEKYSGQVTGGTQRFTVPELPIGCNSGLMGMFVARMHGATRIILLGFDMHGTHYFGRHPAPLMNTTEKRFKQHMGQFRYWKGPEVINCTPNSAMKRFKMGTLRDVL